MKKILSALLVSILFLLPIPASAQGQLGSITLEKRVSELDSSGAHPVTFELSGGDLTEAIRLDSSNYMVRFTDLTPGTYLIREISTRTGDVSRGTIAPVTVTIPQGTLFDVTLYPKTQPLTLLKSSDIGGITPGDTFTYHLDGTVPLPDTNGTLHRYIFRDSLPEGVALTGSSTMEMRTGSQSTGLNVNEHYIVSSQDASTITAMFTSSGLDLLARERATHDDLIVRFSFGVRTSSDLAFGTQLLNIANLYPDGFPETGNESVISNEHSLRVTRPPLPTLPTLPVIPGIPGLPDPPTTAAPAVPQEPDTSAFPSEDVAGLRPEEQGEKNNILASTGASVIGLVALGALLAIAGITTILRGRRA